MKISQLAIYSGLFIILSSFGDRTINFFPSWTGFVVGSLFLSYGVFKEYRIDKKFNLKFSDSKIKWLKLPSKVYILMGIVLARINKFIESIDDNKELRIFCLLTGILMMAYGVLLHFDEKRRKKNSGNLEK